MVAGWREDSVLQHADGLQGRSAIHVRAATIWRAVCDAERRNAGRAIDRQSVGRRRPGMASAEELNPPRARSKPTELAAISRRVCRPFYCHCLTNTTSVRVKV